MNNSSPLNRFTAVKNDVSNKPFRLFFLSACLAAVLGGLLDTLLGASMPDNGHLINFFFLQNMTSAVYAGFLFTAIPKWTKDKTPLGSKMQILWLIWVLASVVAVYSLAIGLASMGVFWFAVLIVATQMVYKHRDSRQLSFLLSLSVSVIFTLWLAYKAWQNQLSVADWDALLTLHLLAFVIITFRMGKAIGSQALKDGQMANSQFIPNPYYKNAHIILLASLLISQLFIGNAVISGWLSLGVASATLGRLRDWHFAVLLKQHYVRWLYMALLLLAVAYAWRGLILIGIFDAANMENAVFQPALYGFFVLMLQMMNFAWLRNSGYPVAYGWPNRGALGILMLVCGIVYTEQSFALSDVMIAVAFSIYFIKSLTTKSP